MTLQLHLQITGALLVALALAHGFFSRYFGWKAELASISVFTRQVFHVHSFFIALTVAMFGICSLFYTDALLQPGPLSRVFLAGMTAFWLCRLFVQAFVYDSSIWRGRPFYTAMHAAFLTFWAYAAGTYGTALWRVS
jgi:hypothetical protein